MYCSLSLNHLQLIITRASQHAPMHLSSLQSRWLVSGIQKQKIEASLPLYAAFLK